MKRIQNILYERGYSKDQKNQNNIEKKNTNLKSQCNNYIPNRMIQNNTSRINAKKTNLRTSE